jgi:hypothetical protein
MWRGDLWPLEQESGVTGAGWSVVSWRRGLRLVEAAAAKIRRLPQGSSEVTLASGQTFRVMYMPVAMAPGFALNTALYASAWYLLLFTPFPLFRAGRRRFRVSRGMCPACAYDLKGSPRGPCPECGHAPAKS